MALHPRPTDPQVIATADPLELSRRLITTGAVDEPVNRTTNQLSVIDDGIAIVESFSHLYAFRTADGLVCFDASSAFTGEQVTSSLRSWSTERISHLVYTHGHVDHVGGSGAIAADAAARRLPRPSVIGHEAIPKRFQRYEMTSGYNAIINMRQFGGRAPERSEEHLPLTGSPGDRGPAFLPADVLWPDQTYSDRLRLEIGELRIDLHHGRGETDDHTWAWIPQHRALVVGDFVCWVFPNAGNPQKVQRYPLEWSQVLRTMQSYDAELLLPAHGLAVRGREAIDTILGDMATALEILVWSTLNRMNAGCTLDEIVNEVEVPKELLAKPWLQPVYDEPEFVIRNIWRMYGGWWDQDPASLKPPSRVALASEVIALAGGVEVLVERARGHAAVGDFRLACQLIEFATQGDPGHRDAHEARAEIYADRRRNELSLMAKGVYGSAARQSAERLEQLES